MRASIGRGRCAARVKRDDSPVKVRLQQHQQPDHADVDEREHHRGAADVLGALGEAVVVERYAVDGRLDRGIEQLDDQDQQHAADQQRALDAGLAEAQPERHQHRGEQQLLPERVLVARRRGEPGKRIAASR